MNLTTNQYPSHQGLTTSCFQTLQQLLPFALKHLQCYQSHCELVEEAIKSACLITSRKQILLLSTLTTNAYASFHSSTSDWEPQTIKSLLKSLKFSAVVFDCSLDQNPKDLRWLRAVADATGTVMIADEIQSGFAHRDRMPTLEHFQVVPDILLTHGVLQHWLQPLYILACKAWISKQTHSLNGI